MDPRITFKVRFLGKSGEDGVGLAFAPWISIPVGGYGPWKDSFQGDKLPTVHARLIADYVWGGLHAAVNVGYFWRDEHLFYSTMMEDELTYGGAISYRLHDNVTLMGEVFGSVALTTCKDRGSECKSKGIFTDNNAGMPLEVGGGARFHVWQFDINVGGFGGIIPAVGTPMFRAFLGLNWVPTFEDDGEEAPRTDRDLDGIENKKDACPDEPEDYDDFEDRDGCPEDDNDKDGVKDGYDSCPLEPEDMDGFEDEDGCPDLDHDHDGVDEENDECPEDPEDVDGFEDDDGCPEPDNDKDGIEDEDDLCPDDPEDLDGYEDDDGCPDLDDDGDGIPDVDDKCPNKAEVFNGINSDDIVGDKSFQILDVVAYILKANPEFKVEVQGHTDNKGGHKHNMDLSQRRAESVVKYLVGQGVSADNLVAKGYGPDMPIASNKKKKGRKKNRRVEFHILSDEAMEEMSEAGEEPAEEEASEEAPAEKGGDKDADMKFDYPED
ncbi:MAG: OmpA family protein [Deltaproteobacteria bacterium]|nr:OmpA family protein [Deltaproteobacteria bacterium]